MGRFRLIFEGELASEDDIVGLSEQVALRLEDLSDVRLIDVRRELCGCLVCRHGNPIRESYERKVFCMKQAKAFGALDCCPDFEEIPMKDRITNPDIDRRYERFNKFFRQT